MLWWVFREFMGYQRKCQQCGDWFEVKNHASLCDRCDQDPPEDPEAPFELNLNDRKFLKSLKIVPK